MIDSLVVRCFTVMCNLALWQALCVCTPGITSCHITCGVGIVLCENNSPIEEDNDLVSIWVFRKIVMLFSDMSEGFHIVS
jgi:hypothetical protein